jgi:hypothetical protein
MHRGAEGLARSAVTYFCWSRLRRKQTAILRKIKPSSFNVPIVDEPSLWERHSWTRAFSRNTWPKQSVTLR